ncbi:HWE histidine kinase domain-containing protein [Pararhizobium sp. DWP1-1-3]|uniref:HWE histidine kinase domain-containing protein n=1 Tax=Pararhizobium sp. DWP1-1-3 TaxID=2804652 RepID=UPI003CEAFB18
MQDTGGEGLYVVAFQEMRAFATEPLMSADGSPRSPEAVAAEQELRTTRAQLQATIGDLETANEENSDGAATSIISVTLEIEERKRAEEHAALLLGELDHRVKNILAIVSSIVGQTLQASSSPEAFAETITGRITAITRAHSLLTSRQGGGSGTLRELVETELKPYGDWALQIEGPDVALTPKAGLSLAMALHELASNAAKYGSLSVPKGQLSVSWAVTDGSDRRLRLHWAETHGPVVNGPPSRRGFGTTVIDRSLSYEFDGEVTRSFAESGVVCIIELPFTAEVGELRPVALGGRQ